MGKCDPRAEYFISYLEMVQILMMKSQLWSGEKVLEVLWKIGSSEIRRSATWGFIKLEGSFQLMRKLSGRARVYMTRRTGPRAQMICESREMTNKWVTIAPKRQWRQNSSFYNRQIKKWSKIENVWGAGCAVGKRNPEVYLLAMKNMKY